MGLAKDIREGLAANLAGIGTEIGAVVSAYRLDSPPLPCIHIFPGPIEFDSAGSRGEDVRTYVVEVLVGTVDDRSAQEVLDELLAPAGVSSVKEAVESDPTLSGAVYDLRVTSCTGAQDYDHMQQGRSFAHGANWTVEVRAPGA